MKEELRKEIAAGEKSLAAGETLVALVHFETAYQLQPLPEVASALGFCLAKERRQYQQALALCRSALEADPADPRHYYHLGRIYLLGNRKAQAITAFRRGLKIRRYQPIIDEMRRLGVRKPPVFATLPREHPLNRSVGALFARIGLR